MTIQSLLCSTVIQHIQHKPLIAKNCIHSVLLLVECTFHESFESNVNVNQVANVTYPIHWYSLSNDSQYRILMLICRSNQFVCNDFIILQYDFHNQNVYLFSCTRPFHRTNIFYNQLKSQFSKSSHSWFDKFTAAAAAAAVRIYCEKQIKMVSI